MFRFHRFLTREALEDFTGFPISHAETRIYNSCASKDDREHFVDILRTYHAARRRANTAPATDHYAQLTGARAARPYKRPTGGCSRRQRLHRPR